MRSRRIPIAALLPRKLGGQSANCGTCFTARSLTSNRVIYEVDEGSPTVRVLTIRHGAQRKLKPSDLE